MRQISSQHHESNGWPVWIILVAMIGTLVVVAAEQPLPPPEVARIAGRLTMEGQPLARHSVVFMEPSRGDLAFGVTDDDGLFVVDSWKNGEMVPGRYKAYVVPPSVKVERYGRFRNRDSNADEMVTLPNEFHDRYLQVTTTPLEYKIAIGENRFEIDVEPKQSDSKTPPQSQ